MLGHQQASANPDRYKLLYGGENRMHEDGYNSLKYKRVNIAFKPLYTWILVDLKYFEKGGKRNATS